MMGERSLRRLTLAVCASGFAFSSAAWAQTFPPPVVYLPKTIDEVGVDLTSRMSVWEQSTLSIGDAANMLEHRILSRESRFAPYQLADNHVVGMTGSSSCAYIVGSQESSECFDLVSGVFVSRRQMGGRLESEGQNLLLYTNRDGVRYHVDTARYGYNASNGSGIVTSIERPDGVRTELTWKGISVTYSGVQRTIYRLQSVDMNNGFSLKYEYASDVGTPSTPNLSEDWRRVEKVTGYNRAVENCPSTAMHCTFGQGAKSANFVWAVQGNERKLTVIDPRGSQTVYRMDGLFRIIGYTPSNSSVERFQYTYCRNGVYGDPCEIITPSGVVVITEGVKWVVRDGKTWTYDPELTFGGCNCYYYNASIAPDARAGFNVQTETLGAHDTWLMQASGWGKQWLMNLDDPNRVSRFIESGRGETHYTYDTRGNVLEERRVASGLADVVTMAFYSCPSSTTCNKPTSVTDPKGNVTTYTYHEPSGQIATITSPVVGGVSPQIRNAYVQRYAVYYNNSGVMAQASSSIWLLNKTSYCRTSAWTGTACSAGATDEVVTTYDYGPTTGANSLLMRGKAVTADGVTYRTCYGYDHFGNQISGTSPNADWTSCP